MAASLLMEPAVYTLRADSRPCSHGERAGSACSVSYRPPPSVSISYGRGQVHGRGLSTCTGLGCAAAPASWGPGVGLSREQTLASVQAGKPLKPELQTRSHVGQGEQGTYSCFSPSCSLVLTSCQRVRASTPPGCHPEPSLVPASLREQVQQA